MTQQRQGQTFMYPNQMGPFFPQSGFPAFQQMPQQFVQQQTDIPGMLPMEQSYIENILRLNRGKHVTVYMTFENNREWNAKVCRGIIEAAGRDNLQ